MADTVMNPAPPGGVNGADLAAHQARLQAAFANALSEDDIRAIARTLTAQAREGDRTSARLVLKYGLGTARADAKRPAKPAARDADFLATARGILKEMDRLEAEERRHHAAQTAARPPTSPPQPRR